MLTYWAQLLHFYQPPTQTHEILEKVARESYRPLLRVLLERPAARIAVNMNAVLTQMLVEHGMGDVIDDLRVLAERGQIEFVGSGAYHPILPLIPEAERERSIAENAHRNRELFGPSYAPRGFFPPELCYSAAIVDEVAAAGHAWLLLSGVACPGEWSTGEVASLPGRNARVLFRDDVRSNRISFKEVTAAAFVADLQRVAVDADAYVVTAMDAETYGHHIAGWESEFLAAAYDEIAKPAYASVRVVQPSEVVGLFPAGPVVEPLDSSWSTTRDDIAAKNAYPLWHAPGNEVHALQWAYVEHCLDLLATARRHAGTRPPGEAAKFASLAGDALQPALHSCQFWWASRRPMWDVPMVLRGLQLLTTVLTLAARSVELGEAAAELKKRARWRVAAANEARNRLERMLIEGPA